MTDRITACPLHVFRFQVDFREDSLQGMGSEDIPLCSGAFSECSGLEATMEPKVIKVGGRNYGAVQRAGPVTFATVILKRGVTRSQDLWRWFEMATGKSAYTYRLAATITMKDTAGNDVIAWKLEKAQIGR